MLDDLIRIVCICLCLRAQGAEVACRGRTKARHKQGQEADECMQGTCIVTLVASIASGAMEVHDVVREMVDAVLSAEFMAPLSQWKTIVGIFEESGLAWKQNLEASCLLVHPANRSGLGVNSHAVHAKRRRQPPQQRLLLDMNIENIWQSASFVEHIFALGIWAHVNKHFRL